MTNMSSGLVFTGRQWSVENKNYLPLDTELRVTAFNDSPHLSIYQLRDGSYKFDGYLYDVWEIIAKTLNLRYRLVPLPNSSYGCLDEHGNWTGMSGELAYGRADVALTWIFMREDRSEVMDFLDAVSIDETSDAFYISKSSVIAPSSADTFFAPWLRPLHINVWWAWLVTLLVLSLVLKGTVRFSRAEDRRSASEATWASCLFSTFISFVGQSWSSLPSSLSGRTVTIFTWFVHICIHTSYTATLISSLTVVTVNRPISSLKDFCEQPDWILAMRSEHVSLTDWKVSQNKYEQKLYQRVMSKDRFVPLKTTRESALGYIRPNVLTYADRNRLLYHLGSEACSLLPLNDQPAKAKQNFIPVAKRNDSLRRDMNRVLQRMHEVGVIQALKNRWLYHNIACVSRSNIEPVSISNSVALLMVLAVGLLASGIIIVLELLWFNQSTLPSRFQIRMTYFHR